MQIISHGSALISTLQWLKHKGFFIAQLLENKRRRCIALPCFQLILLIREGFMVLCVKYGRVLAKNLTNGSPDSFWITGF